MSYCRDHTPPYGGRCDGEQRLEDDNKRYLETTGPIATALGHAPGAFVSVRYMVDEIEHIKSERDRYIRRCQELERRLDIIREAAEGKLKR